MILKKLHAGALQLTLFIVVVVALLLAAFLILVHIQQKFHVQTDFVIETVETANKGIQHSFNHQTPPNTTTTIDLDDEDYKSLELTNSFWGVFEKVISSSKIKNHQFQKSALIGGKQQDLNRMALYVEDNNKPMVLVGTTRIQGVAYLPQRGVKTGNISGHSYYGEQLIFGTIRTSYTLPKLASEILNALDDLSNIHIGMEPYQFLDMSRERSFKNSFLDPPQILYSQAATDLSHISLTGHIIVQSETKIVVDQTSKLIDVVLIAPEIEIRDHVKGTFQAFASESITVGNYCTMDYPSSLVLYKKEIGLLQPQPQPQLPPQQPQILLGNQTTIKGVVVFNAPTEIRNFKPQIVIDEDTAIVGEVYCTANLELKGDVFGTVYTSNFVANQSGSIYQNHIYNGTINVDRLPQQYVGLQFEDSQKEVMKWLY